LEPQRHDARHLDGNFRRISSGLRVLLESYQEFFLQRILEQIP
jgi:hypothetical protein